MTTDVDGKDLVVNDRVEFWANDLLMFGTISSIHGHTLHISYFKGGSWHIAKRKAKDVARTGERQLALEVDE